MEDIFRSDNFEQRKLLELGQCVDLGLMLNIQPLFLPWHMVLVASVAWNDFFLFLELTNLFFQSEESHPDQKPHF